MDFWGDLMFPELLQDSGSYLLSLIVFLPTVFGVAVLLAPERAARVFGLIGGALTFLLSLLALSRFDTVAASGNDRSSWFQMLESVSWLPSVGANYILGVDGLSLAFVILTSFLSLLVLIHSWSVGKNVPAYIACMLFLESGMLGTFLALDGLLFYIFWEVMLIPMYFLIGIWGGARKRYAALKFVIYTALGGLLMLAASVYLAWAHGQQFGASSFYFGDWVALSLSPSLEMWLFVAFALAFAIKVPVFPLHTWLPDAHVEAPTGGSVILAGIMLKLGLYGLIRIGLPVFPEALIAAAPVFVVLGVAGIIYGALVAWVQTDVKKLVAYSSVSHLGFCVLGFAVLGLSGLQGSILQMINHGVSTSALFFLVGVLYERKHTREISAFGGLASIVPAFSAVFLVFTLSSIGLPLTNGFVGEFMILLGAFNYSWIIGLLAVSGVVLGALYMLALYRSLVFGPTKDGLEEGMPDLTFREGLVLAPLLILVFVLGIYPAPVLNLMEPVSQRSLNYIEQNLEDGSLIALKGSQVPNIQEKE